MMATAAGSTPRFVTTIDFGTTHCSVAYLLRPDLEPIPSEVDPTVLKLDNAGNRRVPSCILFDSNGAKIAFGHEARERYAARKRELKPQYHYFEHVKKHLQHEKDIDRNQKVSAMNGKQFFLVDVIAHILHHLKCQLLTELRDFGHKELRASDIHWVITVPAFWKPMGRRMMREAGYMAGLCSDSEPPNLCIATGEHSPPQEEKSPEKLSLASEPESAAIHCRHKAKVAGKGVQYVVSAKTYLVVDIGGGTVDIASHAIVGGSIEEIATPAGNFWGGTTVNEKFSKFLQKFVGDLEFSRYLETKSPEDQARHKADLNKLLYTTFESQKKRFGSGEAQDSYTVEFPHTFSKAYEDSLVKKGRALNEKGDMSVEVEDDGTVMRICDSKMKEFFQPAIDGIMNLIETHLRENKIARTIDTIYWVGGFGGCKYLRNQLEKLIGKEFQGCTYHFPVPPEPELAVIRGATTFRCDPSIVTKKKPDSEDLDPVLSPKMDAEHQQLKQLPSTSSSQTASTNAVPNSHKDESSEALPTSTDTLDEKQLVDITSYLVSMQKDDIYKLGLVLGLNHTKLRAKMSSDTFLEDVIAAWLHEEDYVKEKGDPTWTVLIAALKHPTVKQTGIANTIIVKEKGLS